VSAHTRDNFINILVYLNVNEYFKQIYIYIIVLNHEPSNDTVQIVVTGLVTTTLTLKMAQGPKHVGLM
jgi:hypothetical protein